ncbi:hypothetical protein [Nocardia africana]
MTPRLKIGDEVRAPLGRRMWTGRVIYVGATGYEIHLDVEGCSEPVHQLWRFAELEGLQQ